jgi:hypothetical protein
MVGIFTPFVEGIPIAYFVQGGVMDVLQFFIIPHVQAQLNRVSASFHAFYCFKYFRVITFFQIFVILL